MTNVDLSAAQALPLLKRPVTLLVLMAIASPVAFATWTALLNNFVVEQVGFTGVEIGWLHTVREIPGFLAIGLIPIIIILREQTLALVSLLLLGGATAITAWFPFYGGLLFVTLLSSIGFHFFEAVNQSLQLQWLPKDRAPQVLGWLVAVGSAAALVAYGLLVTSWTLFDLSYNTVYLIGGGSCVAIALYCYAAFPKFEGQEQTKKLVLRRRYWLFYALQFMAGARRQIFVVFAAFMMVERFGFEVHELTGLFMVNFVFNIMFAPLVGRLIAHWGERNVLVVEYIGLIAVFLAYGGIFYFGWGVVLAALLFIVDHLFFAMAFARTTYFQKIADPGDIAPTAAVSFTINHIAAVFLPALLGYFWVVSPGSVFVLAAAMAAASLTLALLIPRDPAPGRETVFSGRAVISAE